MPVTARIDPDSGIAYYSATGELVRDEVIGVLEQVYSDPAFRAPWRSLWDLRNAAPRLDSDDLRAVLTHVETYRPEDAGKIAIVATADLAYGMGRMYELMASDLEVETSVFRDADLALQWLMEGEGETS